VPPARPHDLIASLTSPMPALLSLGIALLTAEELQQRRSPYFRICTRGW
jgi:hypothetical protein